MAGERARKAAVSPLDAPPTSDLAHWWFAGGFAVSVHAAAVIGVLAVAALPRVATSIAPVLTTQLVEVALEPALAPAAEPEPAAPAEPKPEPEPAPRASKVARSVEPEPPPEAAPAAAQAAETLTAAPEVLDFGDTLVQGSSATFAGGVTEAGGTSQRAVRDPGARAGGVGGGRGTDTSAVDRSRPPALAGDARWDCPFPEEADDAEITDALVTLRVRVATDGAVERVDVVQDPGDGFGREARRCALRKRWQPGRDRAGRALATHALVNVRFYR